MTCAEASICSASTYRTSSRLISAGPEDVTGQIPQAAKHCCDNGGRSRCVRVPRIAHDPQHTILSDRAGRPVHAALLGEPPMHLGMADMGRIDQCDQDIHVQQKSHGVSSRSVLTISSVTTALSLLISRSGTVALVLCHGAPEALPGQVGDKRPRRLSSVAAPPTPSRRPGRHRRSPGWCASAASAASNITHQKSDVNRIASSHAAPWNGV